MGNSNRDCPFLKQTEIQTGICGGAIVMRVYFTIFISILLAAISCIFLSGCNNTNNVKNDSVRYAKSDSEIVSINIHETGGEDGRNIEWKVYSQNDSFFLSYSDNNKTYGEPFQGIFEITEQEYQTIMSLDYQKYIDEYDESFSENITDAVYFQSNITHENGDTEATNAIMTEATIKLQELLNEYKNDNHQ